MHIAILSPYWASLLPIPNTPLSIQSLNKILSHIPCPIPGGLHPGEERTLSSLQNLTSLISSSRQMLLPSGQMAKPGKEGSSHHLSDSIFPHLIHYPRNLYISRCYIPCQFY